MGESSLYGLKGQVLLYREGEEVMLNGSLHSRRGQQVAIGIRIFGVYRQPDSGPVC